MIYQTSTLPQGLENHWHRGSFTETHSGSDRWFRKHLRQKRLGTLLAGVYTCVRQKSRLCLGLRAVNIQRKCPCGNEFPKLTSILWQRQPVNQPWRNTCKNRVTTLIHDTAFVRYSGGWGGLRKGRGHTHADGPRRNTLTALLCSSVCWGHRWDLVGHKVALHIPGWQPPTLPTLLHGSPYPFKPCPQEGR